MSAAEEIWRNSEAFARITDTEKRQLRAALGIQIFIDTTGGAVSYTYKHGEPHAPVVPRPSHTPETCPCSPLEPDCKACATSDQSEHPGIPLWDPGRHAELAAMGEPLGLGGGQLPGYETIPPGCCAGCHYPVPTGTTRCWYCTRLAELRKEQQRILVPRGADHCRGCVAGPRQAHMKDCQPPQSRRKTCGHPRGENCVTCYPVRPPRPVVRPLALIGVAIALLVVSVYLVPWLSLAAVFLLTTAFYRAMRSQP